MVPFRRIACIETDSVAQICVADLLCYAGLLPRHEEDAAVDGPQACVCLSFTSSVCKPPNGWWICIFRYYLSKMCGLYWSTLNLGYLPDRYIIYCLILRLSYVASLTKHILRPFICLKVECNYMLVRCESIIYTCQIGYYCGVIWIRSIIICFCVYFMNW